MALEKLGLQAVLEDANFQAGLKRLLEGEAQATSSTEKTAGVLSMLGDVASTTLVAGIAAATAAFAAMVGIGVKGFSELNKWGAQLDSLGDQFGLTGEKAAAFTFLANKMGLSVDEMGMGLRSLINGLDGVKQAAKNQPQEWIPAKTPEQIAALNNRLEDAKVRLERAQKAMRDSKKPTDQMRYAVDDARKAVERLDDEMAEATALIPKKMKAAADSTTPFQKALDKLGVSAFDNNGKLKTFDTLLPELMDKFSKLPPGINASALAMDLFGTRGGSKFLDFLRQGSAGLADASAKVREFGLSIDEDTVPNIEEFGFAVNEMNAEIGLIWAQIGNELLPVLRDFVHIIKESILPLISKWVKDNMPALRKAILEMRIWFYDKAIPALKEFWKVIKEKVLPILGSVVEIIRKVWEGKDVSKDIKELAKKIGDELKRQWPVIQSALNQWAKDFWNWLFAPNGAVSQAAVNMDKLTNEIQRWSNDPSTKQDLQNIGKSIGQSIVDGVKEQLSSNTSGSAIKDALISGLRLGFTTAAIPTDISANIVTGIANSIIANFTSQAFADAITPKLAQAFTTIFASVFNPLYGLYTSITGMVNSIRDLIAQATVALSVDLLKQAWAYVIGVALHSILDLQSFLISIGTAARDILIALAQQLIIAPIQAVISAFGYIIGTAINNILDILSLSHTLNPLYGKYGVFSPGKLAPAGAAAGASSVFSPSYGGSTYNFNMTVNTMASHSTVTRDFGIMRSLAGA